MYYRSIVFCLGEFGWSHNAKMVQQSVVNRVDPDSVDAMLAAELSQMTFQERERVCEEIHGVDHSTNETEEMLDTSLLAMDLALQQEPNRAIYDQAKAIDAKYVEDRSFRLMFLRSESYNAKRAASRLVNFLENKAKLFGSETLARPVYLSDLNEDDIAVLKSGILQLIPARDRSGRVIVSDFNFGVAKIEQPKHMNNYMKALAYIVLTAAEDEETQRRGLIGMMYFTDAFLLIQKLHERRGPRLFDWLPIKLMGVHFCYDDVRFRILQAMLLLMMGKERRVRARMHEGSHTECQYKLMTFGMPVSAFPVGYEGELKTAAHLKWLDRRIVKETALQSGRTFEGIDLPHNRDVLLGRGKSIQDHTGNVELRSLIAEYMPEYRNAAKKEKAGVVVKVMMVAKKRGMRFLKRHPNGWWMEVSDETAREKISMTYRTSRSLQVMPDIIRCSRKVSDFNGLHSFEGPASKKAKIHDGE